MGRKVRSKNSDPPTGEYQALCRTRTPAPNTWRRARQRHLKIGRCNTQRSKTWVVIHVVHGRGVEDDPSVLFEIRKPRKNGEMPERVTTSPTAVVNSIDRSTEDRTPNCCLPFDGIGARHPSIVALSGHTSTANGNLVPAPGVVRDAEPQYHQKVNNDLGLYPLWNGLSN